MDWREASVNIPPLTDQDIARLNLSEEDAEQVLVLYNRALFNARSDGADVALIALKRLLTRFPNWGEAALLYGICLAQEGKLKRSMASFEHALSSGLISEQMTYLAQICQRDAGIAYSEKSREEKEQEEATKGLFTALAGKTRSANLYKDAESSERKYMQAPILMKAPRNPGRAKLATDKERRDALMQANSSNGELLDDEIDVSIPMTPAEKMRITMIVLSSIMGAVGLALLIWFVIIPRISAYQENNRSAEKLEYLLSSLKENKEDPEVSEILASYDLHYSHSSAETTISEGTTTSAADAVEAEPSSTTEATSVTASAAADPTSEATTGVSPGVTDTSGG